MHSESTDLLLFYYRGCAACFCLRHHTRDAMPRSSTECKEDTRLAPSAQFIRLLLAQVTLHVRCSYPRPSHICPFCPADALSNCSALFGIRLGLGEGPRYFRTSLFLSLLLLAHTLRDYSADLFFLLSLFAPFPFFLLFLLLLLHSQLHSLHSFPLHSSLQWCKRWPSPSQLSAASCPALSLHPHSAPH